jgi:cytochrome c-type biogenesis protein CcmH
VSRQRLAWLALAAVVATALLVAVAGSRGENASRTEQAETIARSVRCPTCRGQSVAESAAPAAQAIRAEIGRRLDAGESRDEIESYLVGRYGSDILLTPPRGGVGGLVWVVPVVVIVGAAAGLGLALQRWSRRSLAQPSDEDRALVAQAEQGS